MANLPITTAQLITLCQNIEYLADIVESTDDTALTPNGLLRNTVQGQLREIGYIPPVVYGGGISFGTEDFLKTIDRNGTIYAPLPSELPFTTSGTWAADDEDKFFVVQGGTDFNDFALVNETRSRTNSNPQPLAFIAAAVDLLFGSNSDSTAIARFTTSDGDGNFNMRFGHRIVSNVARYVGNNGAVDISLNGTGADGFLRIRIAPQGLDGDVVVWGNTFNFNPNSLTTIGNLILSGSSLSALSGVFTAGSALLLSNGNASFGFDGADFLSALKRISANDGGANWGFRAGHAWDGVDARPEYIQSGDGASAMIMQSDGVDGEFIFQVAPVNAGSPGDEVLWARQMRLTLNDLLLDNRSLTKVGAISIWPGEIADIPAGALICQGAAVSRTTYSDLFAVIGVKYGDGDGATTFNLPDMRGYGIRGVGNQPNAQVDVNTAIVSATSLVTLVASVGIEVGMQVTGTGIPANTFLASFDPLTGIGTLSNNATATGSFLLSYFSRLDRGDGTLGDVVGTKQFNSVGPHNHDVEAGNNTSNGDTLARSSNVSAINSTEISSGVETRMDNINVYYIINY